MEPGEAGRPPGDWNGRERLPGDATRRGRLTATVAGDGRLMCRLLRLPCAPSVAAPLLPPFMNCMCGGDVLVGVVASPCSAPSNTPPPPPPPR